MAKLAEEQTPKQVQLSMMQAAEGLYNTLVKGSQAQASILSKVENELKALAQDAKELAKIEQRLEAMAKELGVDPDSYHYEGSLWVSSLTKYANEVGVISNKL